MIPPAGGRRRHFQTHEDTMIIRSLNGFPFFLPTLPPFLLPSQATQGTARFSSFVAGDLKQEFLLSAKALLTSHFVYYIF